MTTGAGTLDRHVIDPNDRVERAGVVTVFTAVVGANMIRRLRRSRSAGGVTTDAGLGDAAVIESSGGPTAGDMTVVARRCRLQVVQ